MIQRTLDEIRAGFARDRFATAKAGIRIDEAVGPDAPGGARVVCTMPVTPDHLNAAGGVMGGAIFTLADFCAAILGNAWDERPSMVSVSASIQFLGPCKGSALVCTCVPAKSGRSVLFCDCRIADDLGNAVAEVQMTDYRVQPRRPAGAQG